MTSSTRPSCALDLRVRTLKWPDSPHWEFDAVDLGTDHHGRWLGVPKGTPISAESMPERAFSAVGDHVVLVPEGGWYLATFYDTRLESSTDTSGPAADTDTETAAYEVYVDITTPATTDGNTLVAVDLDLDVVRRPGAVPLLDDQDEFDEHRIAWGYPPEVIQSALSQAGEVLSVMANHRGPFGGVHEAWIDVLRASLADHQ